MKMYCINLLKVIVSSRREELSCVYFIAFTSFVKDELLGHSKGEFRYAFKSPAYKQRDTIKNFQFSKISQRVSITRTFVVKTSAKSSLQRIRCLF